VFKGAEIFRGRSWIWPDNVNTDLIVPFRLESRTNDPEEISQYCMYGLDQQFHDKVHEGDVFVAGKNFGCGSSREQAPIAIKYSGVSAVIAESFARIFYRNCFALGLPALEVRGLSSVVSQGERIQVDLRRWCVTTLGNGKNYSASPVPLFLREVLGEGGLVEYYRRHKRFPW
jgi:3-isopropylmalate/(R)-2-methylmalate dehydratase small subunit